MGNSLRWKLVGWYTLLVTIMAFAFAALTVLTIRHTLRTAASQEQTEIAERLLAVLELDEDGQFDVVLTRDQIDAFSADYPQGPYYRIWNRQEQEVDGSSPDIPNEYPAEVGVRWRSGQVEWVVDGPARSRILVGRSFDNEQNQVRELALVSGFATVLTMLVTSVGGWMLIGQALSPISRMSDAASRVTEANISQRIDTDSMEIELLHLSETFNNTLDRLEDAYQRQIRFTADASHELRTPLSVILAQSEHTLTYERTRDEYVAAIGTMRRAALRMQSLVDGLLTLARADADHLMLDRRPCRLDEILSSACQHIRPLADQKGITISMSLMDATVDGDSRWLGEAATNLLSNAVRHSHPDGVVELTVEAAGDTARIHVRDHGVGIDEQYLPHVFDRFYRVEQSRSGGGTGLGLAITKWVVEAHDGNIQVASVRNEGSTFTIILPTHNASRLVTETG